ncbi:MAG: hypothetical protein LAT65_00485 [Saccharospirillum sp.]|nr:hypothetical protein [Saccharospirillum sp.]
MIPLASPLRVSLPFEPLRPYISHYWLSIDNTDENYSILPDGSVDLVVVVAGSTFRVEVFGTTTSRAELELDMGSHYLGIRFRAGQCRYFLDVQASELTNANRPVTDTLFADLEWAAESIMADSLFVVVDPNGIGVDVVQHWQG